MHGSFLCREGLRGRTRSNVCSLLKITSCSFKLKNLFCSCFCDSVGVLPSWAAAERCEKGSAGLTSNEELTTTISVVTSQTGEQDGAHVNVSAYFWGSHGSETSSRAIGAKRRFMKSWSGAGRWTLNWGQTQSSEGMWELKMWLPSVPRTQLSFAWFGAIIISEGKENKSHPHRLPN